MNGAVSFWSALETRNSMSLQACPSGALPLSQCCSRRPAQRRLGAAGRAFECRNTSNIKTSTNSHFRMKSERGTCPRFARTQLSSRLLHSLTSDERPPFVSVKPLAFCVSALLNQGFLLQRRMQGMAALLLKMRVSGVLFGLWHS